MSKKISFLIVLIWAGSLLFAQETGLKIMTYNIHHVEGTDGKIDYQRMAEVIMDFDPDIIALQEVDNKTERTERVNQVERLADLSGYEHFVFGRSMPHEGGEYGLAVISRYPILTFEVHPLPFHFGLEPRTVLLTVIDTGRKAGKITLANTHLCHQSESNRIDQVRRINALVGELEGPLILAGDLNARRENDSMRLMWSRDWVDCSDPYSRIDYILTRKRDGAKVIKAQMLEDKVTSDHFPIMVELAFSAIGD